MFLLAEGVPRVKTKLLFLYYYIIIGYLLHCSLCYYHLVDNFVTSIALYVVNNRSRPIFLALRPVSIAALLVARVQRSTLRHAQQENNEVRNDRELSCGS